MWRGSRSLVKFPKYREARWKILIPGFVKTFISFRNPIVVQKLDSGFPPLSLPRSALYSPCSPRKL